MQWQKFTYVTSVIRYMTIHTNVRKFAPSVLLHHLALKISPSIVVHVTGIFSVQVFRESSNSQSERQDRLSVETSMPKLFLFGNF